MKRRNSNFQRKELGKALKRLRYIKADKEIRQSI